MNEVERLRAMVRELEAKVAELEPIAALINRPETENFLRGVQLEAGHQRWRWGRDHDAGKDPDQWFWTLGFLAGKARHHHAEGDAEKARHHLISSAALLSHWHEHVSATEATVAAAPMGRDDAGNIIPCEHDTSQRHEEPDHAEVETYRHGRAEHRDPPPDCTCDRQGTTITAFHKGCPHHGDPGTPCSSCETPARADQGGKSVWDNEVGKYRWYCADCAVGF